MHAEPKSDGGWWAFNDDDTPLMTTITDWMSKVVVVCTEAWGGVCAAYDNHNRRDEYRQIQVDNDIAASVADLRGVKAMVYSRLIELRAESETHASKVLGYAQSGNKADARVHFRLKMLYDAQYQHTQSTMSAIEAHIVSLEATAVNRRVVRALRRGSAVACDEDEQAAEDVVDSLAEQESTTRRIIQLLGDAPNLAVDGEVDDELHQWLEAEQHKVSPPAPDHPAEAPPPLLDLDLPPAPTHAAPVVSEIMQIRGAVTA